MPSATGPHGQYPLAYRIFFTWLDPVICVWGAYMDFFDPTLVLSSHIPSPKVDMGHAMILRQRGGGMLNFGFISAFLLRHTNDLQAWRIVQIADLVVDIAYFWAVHGALKAQDRLSPSTWRVEDWGSLAITGTAAVFRLAFLAGVGLKSQVKTVKKRV
jgi:hypothetical protein